MADDRMAIVCKECQSGIAIAKFWHRGGWTSPLLNEGRLNAFFAKHADCVGEEGYGGRHYYLGYEMDGSDWVYDEPEVPVSRA